MKNWETTLFGLIALVLPVLAWQGYITDKTADLLLYVCVASGLAVSADAKLVKDKIKNNKDSGTLLLIIVLPFLPSCVAFRQADYDQVAKAFSEKAIRQVFNQPDFKFDSDSIYLDKDISYDIINKVFLGKAHIFTSAGESYLKTLLVKIEISWTYLPETNRVRLKFKRIRHGKYNTRLNNWRARSKHSYRIYCKSLARFEQLERKNTRIAKYSFSVAKRSNYA